MLKIFEHKLVFPPMIVAALVYWAHSTVLQDFTSSVGDAWVTIFFGVFGIFTFGFIISTIGHLILNISDFMSDSKSEFENWIQMKNQGKFVKDQMQKRWEMICLNLNSIIAIAITVLIVVWKHWVPPESWYFAIVVLIALFSTSLYLTWRSFSRFRELIK